MKVLGDRDVDSFRTTSNDIVEIFVVSIFTSTWPTFVLGMVWFWKGLKFIFLVESDLITITIVLKEYEKFLVKLQFKQVIKIKFKYK